MAAALPVITTIATAGGVALTAYGMIQEGRAASDAASYNAAVAERDAQVAEQNRQLAIRTSEIEAADKRRENRRVLASIRANYGASGFSFAGSPLDVLEDTATEQELDAQRIEYDGQVKGRSAALRILGLEDDAALSRSEAANARRAGNLGALGTAVGGVGTTLSRMN